MNDVKLQVSVGRTQRQKNSYVSQAVGARMALLGILPMVKNKKVRDAILEIGRSTDELCKANGGYPLSTFEEVAQGNKEINAHGHD
jgi:hypothetical protein